jgi:hypothetical protein
MIQFAQVCTVAGADTDDRPAQREFCKQSASACCLTRRSQGANPLQNSHSAGFCFGGSYAGSDRTAEYGGSLIRRGLTTNDTGPSVGVVPRARRGVWSRATVKQPARARKSLGYLGHTAWLRRAEDANFRQRVKGEFALKTPTFTKEQT